jgi:hypothetical protein
MAIEWYDDIDRLEHWVTAEGPEGWPRIDSLDSARRSRIMETGEVADIVLEDHRISVSTTAVGVPHLVKVSYFPNWTAVGAEGPYHATPSLMVVVPTQEDVVLEFCNTFAETGGMMLTGGALLGLIGWALLLRHRRRRTEADAAP